MLKCFVNALANCLHYDTTRAADTTYGLFLSNEDPTLGAWLENGRTLDFYKFKSAKVSRPGNNYIAACYQYKCRQSLTHNTAIVMASRRLLCTYFQSLSVCFVLIV